MKTKFFLSLALSGAILVLNADAKIPAKKNSPNKISESKNSSQKENSLENLFRQVQKKYSGAQTVYVEFSSKENPALSGSMKAQRGNKFSLNVADRTIVSNGSTMWNFTKKNNTVLVSQTDGSYQGTPIEKILFTFLESYKLSEAKNISAKEVSFTLVPASAKETIQNVRSVKISVDPKTLELKSAAITSDDGTHSFTVKKIQTDVKFSSTEFEFQSPKGSKIVDMR